MDREQLRQKIVAGNQRLINSRLFRFFSAEEQKLLLAGGAFWQDTSDPVSAQALDDVLARFNSMQGVFDAQEPTTDQIRALGVTRLTFDRVRKFLMGTDAGQRTTNTTGPGSSGAEAQDLGAGQ